MSDVCVNRVTTGLGKVLEMLFFSLRSGKSIVLKTE